MNARSLLLLVFVFMMRIGCAGGNGNRLVYLMEPDPFAVGVSFPKLTTPQWVGESGVEAVVTFGVDDMRASDPYEKFLRPLLERLKKIDGRAPVSIFSVAPTPTDPRLTNWLAEGLSFEVHTLTHPCPILAKSNFTAAASVFFGCVDLLSTIPGNRPVAFRTPCCDSINSASPRLFAEMMCGRGPSGKFVQMDSSVVMLFTTNDTSIAAEDLVDPKGKPRFMKYVPFPAFKTTIENYPYPYVINNVLWEMPFVGPSDWESHNIQGDFSPQLLEDWEKALDLIVKKRGTFNFVFHPHGWSSSTQMVAFVDHVEQAHGKKVKFLNYPEVLSRMNRYLLGGEALRNAEGGDNGVRLIDLNNDGFLDVVIGNERVRRTRLWDEANRKWIESGFPTQMAGARFGLVRAGGAVSVMMANDRERGAWTFDGAKWKEDRDLLNGLEQVNFTENGRDRGARLRDVDGDGVCELIVSNDSQNFLFAWDETLRRWGPMGFTLPEGVSIVNREGEDNGVRFVDVNGDGHDDVILSNEERYSLHLFMPKLFLGFARGWSRQVSAGARSDAEAIPAFVRAGTNRNNGAWFHSKTLWVQNEETAHLPDLVERRSFSELVVGVKPVAKSPEEERKTFQLADGFQIEAVATEPLVVDPVSFEWNAKGELYVVEMRDYPLGIPGKKGPGGVVKLLRDTDGDGKFDKATEFLTEVNFPSGVMPWRGGALISAAPDLIYAEDTDGDGVADVRKVLITGFREGNQQHRFNGFEMGMDGWVYAANGESGGTMKVLSGVLNSSGAPKGEIRLRGDFRFRPDTGELEAIEGTTQFGRRRDDWDDWFGNNNPTWLWHFYLPSRYIERNPLLRVADLHVITAENNNLFPAGKTQQRFNDIGKGNTTSAANSPTFYRDELFGGDFLSSVFISDPSFNLVHREVLEANGVTFKSHRAATERDREFLSSTDNWFRPTTLKIGPDGALYVADMYRFVIEHPEWIPKDAQESMDLRAGDDKGRIWRISRKDAAARKIESDPFVALNSPNGWQRDTAEKILMWRKDAKDAEPLRKIARSGKLPQGRAQALWTLRNIDQASADDILAGLKDSDPRVARQAIRVSETLTNLPASIGEQIAALATSKDEPLTFQAALALWGWHTSNAAKALANAARKHADDRRFLNGVYSSALPHLPNLLQDFGENPPKSAAETRVAAEFFGMVPANEAALPRAIEALRRSSGAWRFAALGSLLDASRGKSAEISKQLDALLSEARKLAVDTNAAEDDRSAAIRLLGARSDDLDALRSLLKPGTTAALQKAALVQLGKMREPAVADAVIGAWPAASTSLRQESLNLLITRPEWIERLLSAIEKSEIPANAINAPQQQRLRENPNARISERANKIFTATDANRRAVIAKYESAKTLSGDAANGLALFRQNCAQCHSFRGEGGHVGPDLGSVADKTAEYLLTAILDPNQAVEARYMNFTAIGKDDSEFSGIVTSETANSITLTAANDMTKTYLRSDLKDLKASGRSIMPDGFETGLSPQAVADIIAYLRTATR